MAARTRQQKRALARSDRSVNAPPLKVSISGSEGWDSAALAAGHWAAGVGLAPSTVRGYNAALEALLTFAQQQGRPLFLSSVPDCLVVIKAWYDEGRSLQTICSAFAAHQRGVTAPTEDASRSALVQQCLAGLRKERALKEEELGPPITAAMLQELCQWLHSRANTKPTVHDLGHVELCLRVLYGLGLRVNELLRIAPKDCVGGCVWLRGGHKRAAKQVVQLSPLDPLSVATIAAIASHPSASLCVSRTEIGRAHV